jgi:5-carboxymethyl-2-hydroxymuconate isomerase
MARIKFKVLGGDINFTEYGGTWISPKMNNGEFDYWLVRKLTNWHEATNDFNELKYHAAIAVVAPSQFPEDEIKSACRCLDVDNWEQLNDEQKVEIIHSYQGGVEIATGRSNNYTKLFKEIDAEAQLSNMLFGMAMDAPRNQLGATGWNLLQGNSWGVYKPQIDAAQAARQSANIK